MRSKNVYYSHTFISVCNAYNACTANFKWIQNSVVHCISAHCIYTVQSLCYKYPFAIAKSLSVLPVNTEI